MIINYDIFNRQEKPSLTLCNPNREELFSLDLCKDAKFSLKYNTLSEITFTFYRSIDNNKTILPAYDYIKNKRLVKIEDFGYFQITSVEENTNGLVPSKFVTAQSQEVELISKRITGFSGGYYFANMLNLSDTSTLLGYVLSLVPSWSAGVIDPDLALKYRDFTDVVDTTIYSFLMNDVEKAYGCVFSFDTFNKKVNASLIDHATSPTDIYFSFENLLKNGKFTEFSDEQTTCLKCYGADPLTIRSVNPIGTDAIYNFDYYKTTEWMSQDLIDAIDAWKAKVARILPYYGDYLTQLKDENEHLLALQNGLHHTPPEEGDVTGLAELQTQYDSLDGVRKARIEQGLKIDDLAPQFASLAVQMTNVRGLITASKNRIKSLTYTIRDINRSLMIWTNDNQNFSVDQQQGMLREDAEFQMSGFSTVNLQATSISTQPWDDTTPNFTEEQQAELAQFVYENTYQNQNIIITDGMTNSQIQQQAQELYDQSVGVLGRVSYPRYEFSVEAVNFLALKDYYHFTSGIELGSEITVDMGLDNPISSVVLEINISFDDPQDFGLVFSNRLRLNNGAYRYSDLVDQITKTSSTTSFNAQAWSDWNNNYKNDVSQFITSALNTANNALINGNDQEIVINQNGLKGRRITNPGNETPIYDKTQVWLTSSIIAFTADNWSTSRLALGSITAPDGSPQFGLVADALIGKMIAGNKLVIQSDTDNMANGASFTFDKQGARFVNADITIDSPTTNRRILINTTDGFKIQSKASGIWENKFSVDTSGNITFSGTLKGASGTFSGTISGGDPNNTMSIGVIPGSIYTGLYVTNDPNKYYIRSNGDLKWGNLTVTGGNFIFDGNISASKITGQLNSTQIGSVNAATVSSGTMYGDRISGGTINGVTLSWDHGSISSSNGTTNIKADANIDFYIGTGRELTLSGNFTHIYGICQMDQNLSVGQGISASGQVYGASLKTSGALTVGGSSTFSGSATFNGSIWVGSNLGQTKTVDLAGIQNVSQNMRLTFTNGILTYWHGI